METEQARRLLDRCAEGRDPEAWREFVTRFGRRLAAAIRRAFRRAGLTPTREEVEDLRQEVYCRLLEREARPLRRCRGSSDRAVVAYLCKIAESVALDHLRASGAAKRGRDRRVEIRDEEGTDWVARAEDPGPSPEDRLLARERKSLALSSFRQAAGKDSVRRDTGVFYLALVEGWSSREICRRLDGAMSPGGIDCLIHRMKRRLARQGILLPARAQGA